MRNPLSSDRRQFRSSVMYAYLKGLALLDLAYLILTVQLCYFVLNSHMWFDPQDSPEPKDDQLRSFICMFHLRPLSIFCTELIQFFYFPDPENFGQRPSSYGLEYLRGENTSNASQLIRCCFRFRHSLHDYQQVQIGLGKIGVRISGVTKFLTLSQYQNIKNL